MTAVIRAAKAITPAIFRWHQAEKQARTPSLELMGALNEVVAAALVGFITANRQPDSCEPEICLDEHLAQIRAAALKLMQA